ncbi:DUF2207 domain-containing protein [Lederbergia galactosidilytica]|uniref:DUF2207 domain-containing protein n=2 Tax=Lederbergia galactosidilytica TaxID=217031 RepID=A0A177ZXK5_9BACI|nr:DUF2207 domain-containing protein [Lederbergia galactosidilytica]KRG12818.1 hypothetical protein ACA30_17500 [Virgibacillus soli]OAK72030.1 hypothetical protein ABB05_09560 [Lederbergia galactosidilytica]
MNRKILSGLIVFFILLFPFKVGAVEFSISNVKIDAYLQKNGDVNVQETHTYQFKGKFNGITREIYPKKGAEITSFLAKERGKTLKVEKEDELYKIHRKGKKETVEITLEYVIKNSLEKHEDITEFYWPFFDQRNETDYGNMRITIYPPNNPEDVIAFGYEQAFDKQSVKANGVVEYFMGNVPSGENGDIRVAYPSILFSELAPTSSKAMKDSLIQEKESLEQKAEAFKENKQRFTSTSKLLIPFFLLLFVILLGWEHLTKKRKYSLIKEKLHQEYMLVPIEKISMPATIYYTLGVDAIHVPAALLDLVRKGAVEQRSEDEFRRLHSNVQHEHERILLKWLFDELGENGYFNIANLETFIKVEKNLSAYHKRLTEWKAAIKKEIKEAGLREKKSIYRGIFGFLAFGLLSLWISAIHYEVIPMFLITFILFLVASYIAFFYRPLSSKGFYIKEEWMQFTNRMNEIKGSDWQKVSDETRMRVIVFGANSKFAGMKKTQQWEKELQNIDSSYMSYSYFTIPILYGGFSQADKKFTDYSSSSSGSSFTGSGGGGVGGGGGGSGAF